jgi:hypothetical protein
VSKFHLIWCFIAQESSLRRKERILGENHVFIDHLLDIVWPSRIMYGSAGQCPTDCSSSTFVHHFDRILLTECLFDHILLPPAS